MNKLNMPTISNLPSNISTNSTNLDKLPKLEKKERSVSPNANFKSNK